MLSKFDDYPIHQTPEPVARPVSSDRNVYDRYWFNGYADDGEFYFGIGLGTYPNRHIVDCGFSIVQGGEQHAFHASRRASGEPSDTDVGPFRIEVVEPMRSVRVVLEPNETGIECDLVFRARTACIEEGRQTLHQGGRLLMDATRFAQMGRWQGHVRYAGRDVPIEPGRVFGTKDRSWGVRPVGEQDGAGAPRTTLPHIFFLWAPLQFRERCTQFVVFEDETGTPWHDEGMIVPAYDDASKIPGTLDPAIEKMARVEHRLTYEKGTRRASAAELSLVARSGDVTEISLEPLLCFRMKGIGYTHPVWGHGLWKGDLAIGGESWKCDDLDPMAYDNQHVQQVMRARLRGPDGEEEGIGVMEQLAFGAHARYGFRELLDPA